MANGTQSPQLVAAFATLRQLLKARGLGHAEIGKALGVSERTIRRWFSQGGVTIEQLETLCALVDISVFDFWELASRRTEDRPRRLTLRQEHELAEDFQVIFVHTHLLDGWTPDELGREANIPQATMTMLLARLEKMGLIENLPGNRVKLLTAREIEWQERGPMRQKVNSYINHQFRNMDVNESGFLCKTGSLKLSVASIAEIEDEFQKLRNKIHHLAHLDMSRSGNDKRWYALLLAARSKVLGAGLF